MATESSVLAVIRASRPSFRNPHDKLAFVVHASFLAAGYSLIAVGQNAFSDNPPTEGDEVGIEGWNDQNDSYGFVYSNTEKGSKKAVLVKCLAIGDVLAVDALNMEQQQKEEPFNLQISVKDHIVDCTGGKGNYGEMYSNLKGLVENLNSGVLSKLEPKIETSSSTSRVERSSNISEHAQRLPSEHQQPPSGLVYPPVPSFGGNRDLYPGAGAGAGFYPDRGSGFGGDMLVGPNDPRWFGSDERAGFPGGIPSVLPGARFDPFGPPGVPGFEPNRFVRQPRRPGGDIHPDLEHFHAPDYI